MLITPLSWGVAPLVAAALVDSRRARFRSSSACCCVVGAPALASVSQPGYAFLGKDGRKSWRGRISEPSMIYQYQLCSLSSNLSSYPEVICFALWTAVVTAREGCHFGPRRWHRSRTDQDLGPGSLKTRNIRIAAEETLMDAQPTW